MDMMFYLYNFCLWVLVPFAAIFYLPFFLREKKHRKNFLSRLRVPDIAPPESEGEKRIWIHAVSVGETLASLPLIRRLKEISPEMKIYFSTITVTGMEVANARVADMVDEIFYLPFDFMPLMERTLKNVSPDVLVIMETEIWPNLIWLARKRGVRIIVANGRFSVSSFPRYRRARFFFSKVLGNVDCFMMQSREDAKRAVAIGAPPDRLEVTGNIKFDFVPPSEVPEEISEFIERKKSGRKVLVCASTHEGEESVLLDLILDLREKIFIVMAPRHPERFDAVAGLIDEAGIKWIRRTRLGEIGDEEKVDLLLLDTIGELSGLYGTADFVFVGGTLVPVGGHNVLEPAYFGKPVLVGPHLDNVKEVVEILDAEGGIFVVKDEGELSCAVRRLCDDEELASRSGVAARKVVDRFRGAVDKVAGKIISFMGD